MTPIEVYTISKDRVLVQDLNCYKTYGTHIEDFYVNRNGVPDVVVVNSKSWRIKRFSRSEDQMFGQEPKIFDTYIAVDPELERLLTMELKSEINALHSCVSFWKALSEKEELRINNFTNLPWWKRVWKALKNEL